MIEQELIRLRKEIKKIRRSKKIRHQRANYITLNVFFSKIYSSCVNKYQKFQRIWYNYVQELIAKNKVFKKYCVISKYLNNTKSSYYIEINLFRGLENNTFKILKKLIKNNNSIIASKIYLISQDLKDKRNKINNLGFNFNNYNGDFDKKFNKNLNLDKKLIKNKLYGNIKFTNKQIQQDSENYNQGYNYRDTLLNGNCFKLRLYVILNGDTKTTKNV